MKNATIIEACLKTCADWGLLPTAFRQCMTWEEQVLWLARFLQETVIPTVNANTEAFNGLRAYVENYFENLDVQEEINTKLDEMAEAGTLQEIIAAYLQANVTWTFDTVSDMKDATNLVAGSYAKTLGFYALNDGGGATYYITDSGTANEVDVIAVGDLYANIVNQDEMNIKQFGGKGTDDTDITSAFNIALTHTNTLFFPAGTYLLNGTVHIPRSKTVYGCKENTKIDYKGTGRALVCEGRYVTLKDFELDADTNVSSDNAKIGITVDPEYAEADISTITNCLIESIIFRRFDTSVSLDNMWQITVRNCIMVGRTKGAEGSRTCYGVAYESSGTVLAGWSGSGNIIESCYITNCSYALHLLGTWNLTCIDTIMEHCYASVYMDSKCSRVILINNWFEANEAQPTLGAPLIMMGGRKSTLSGSSTLEFPNDMNNLHLLFTDGDTINRYNQKLMSNIANEEALLTGIKNQVPASTSVATKITSLKAFTSRGNAITNEGVVSDNNLTGELSLVAYGTSGGNGKTYGNLQYSAGQTNGNAVDVAIRPVFNVDKDGGITNPASTESVDIGSSTNKYRYVWTKNVIVKGDNGNFYKLGVDNSGNVTASLAS